jgi:hypothetical protein
MPTRGNLALSVPIFSAVYVTLGMPMTFDLRSALPVLIPKAIAWAESQSEIAVRTERPLDERFISIAKSVGVVNPEHIRILDVPRLPMPDDPQLKQAAVATGLLGPGMVGLTLGYSVLVCPGYGQDVRLLSHEFRHVCQYEQAGSIAAFLPVYLQQIVTVGYHNAPFEMDARAHEQRHA